jgi:hypothetical protein
LDPLIRVRHERYRGIIDQIGTDDHKMLMDTASHS